MTQLTILPAGTAPEAIQEALKREGACIVEGAMDAQRLAELRAELLPYVLATEPGRDDFTGRFTTRTGALVARSPACREVVMDPSLLGAARTFLAPYCETVQLHLTQLIRIMPGQGVQPLHRDRLAWGGYIPDMIEPQLNTIWAVTDFTKENGATRVVPGSNHWDNGRHAQESEIAYAEMPAGSVLVYSGSVIHGGGANVSDQDRMGLNITYALGWLRQEENQYLSCPPPIAATLEPALRDLIGYSMGSYALGYFTPPTGPGENPEVVPPDFLFNGKVTTWGGEDMLEAVASRVRAQAN